MVREPPLQDRLTMSAINLENLTRRFSGNKNHPDFTAVDGLNFAVESGEVFGFLGPNGAGKTTTIRAISQLVKSMPGSEMTYNGKNLFDFPADKVVSELGVSHVPEGRHIFGNLTVKENLTLSAFARKDKDGIAKDVKRVYSIFPRLEERQWQKAETLSGGEQQMLAVGRAFISGRKIMLLDEPSMGLAPLLMMDMFDALKQINEEGTTILLVEQNARLALKFSQRGYVLESGKIVLEGDSDKLLTDPEVKKAYLGG